MMSVSVLLASSELRDIAALGAIHLQLDDHLQSRTMNVVIAIQALSASLLPLTPSTRVIAVDSVSLSPSHT